MRNKWLVALALITNHLFVSPAVADPIKKGFVAIPEGANLATVRGQISV
jgi:hypothetical protein